MIQELNFVLGQYVGTHEDYYRDINNGSDRSRYIDTDRERNRDFTTDSDRNSDSSEKQRKHDQPAESCEVKSEINKGFTLEEVLTTQSDFIETQMKDSLSTNDSKETSKGRKIDINRYLKKSPVSLRRSNSDSSSKKKSSIQVDESKNRKGIPLTDISRLQESDTPLPNDFSNKKTLKEQEIYSNQTSRPSKSLQRINSNAHLLELENSLGTPLNKFPRKGAYTEEETDKALTTVLGPLESHMRHWNDKEEIKHLEEIEEKIHEEKQSYAEGLTIHGANRIATGRPFSKVIWSILVIASLTTAALISKEHWEAFLNSKSTSNTMILHQQSIPLPAITVCNYDGINKERRNFEGGPPSYVRPTLVNFPSMRACGGLNLTKCSDLKSRPIKVMTISPDYAKTTLQNHLVEFDNTTNCFTIKGLVQPTPSSLLSIQAVVNRSATSRTSEIYINPASETFQETSPTAYWANEGFYHVNIEKKIITHLGKPYTDCVEGKGSHSQNKFKGNYTVTKCEKGCFWEKVFEKCGNIPQMYKKHMREPHRFNNKTFVNNTFGKSCLASIEEDPSVTKHCHALCKLPPCYEEDVKMTLNHNRAIAPNFLELAMTFQSFLIEIVEEVPAYTWQELFANFGGCVGLMTGASILSLFELFIFFGLIFFDFFHVYTKVSTKLPHDK